MGLTKVKLESWAAITFLTIAFTTGCSQNQSTEPDTSFVEIPNELSSDTTVTEFGAVGSCIALSGPNRNSIKAKEAKCGTAESNYRIVAIKLTRDQCPADSDQRYRRWNRDTQQTLCLDFDWVANGCMSIGQETWYAKRVTCTERHAERPTKVLFDVNSVAACPDGGYAHPVRRFTICTQIQK